MAWWAWVLAAAFVLLILGASAWPRWGSGAPAAWPRSGSGSGSWPRSEWGSRASALESFVAKRSHLRRAGAGLSQPEERALQAPTFN